MKRKSFIIVLAAVLMMTAASCRNVKNIAYIQNKTIDVPEKIDQKGGIVIEPKDMVSIIVSGRNPELVAMFNLPVVSFQAGSDAITTTSQQRLMPYTVDNEGFIDFPVLGKIQVKGLTRWQLAELIKTRLADGGYVNDAVVTVDFMNFKVSVLGEVQSPGTYTIQGDKFTIFQAISQARDLTIFGQRENVTVIREKEGERVIYKVNLCDASIFESPAYYLQQNDIVYVEPSAIKARQSTTDDKSLRMTSIVLSGGSLAASIASIVISVLR